MVFSSYSFLFLFLPFVLCVNRFLSLSLSNLFLLLCSLAFYCAGEGMLVLILIFSILWNYGFGLIISERVRGNKLALLFGVAGNLALLGYYKYFTFLVLSSFLKDFVVISAYSEIVLPIGISFFTFQGISYLVDVYRRVALSEVNPIKLGLYISFFPQLIAGPIIKYNEFVPYLSKRTSTLDKTYNGSLKFIRGLAKKVILADSLAIVADQIFATDPSSLPTFLAWIGVLVYSLQIYYDFSGYSDMAIGLCLIMGFKIPENFNYPYISKSLREFWRRWHISLSSWFKNYLYLPLGGNREGDFRTYINLGIVFFLTGLWHGASWNFVLWGLIHGLFMIIERLVDFENRKLPSILKHGYLLFVVGLSWIMFRVDSISEAKNYIQQLFCFSSDGDWYSGIYLNRSIENLRLINRSTKTILYSSVYLLISFYCFVELSISNYQPFIYFKF